MAETTEVNVSTHPAGANADAQSFLVYGVFNGDNSAVQARVHDNFGTPASDQLAQYGMERDFEVESAQLTEPDPRSRNGHGHHHGVSVSVSGHGLRHARAAAAGQKHFTF